MSDLTEISKKRGFPQSLALQVSVSGKKFLRESFGKPYRYYDVASLTKILVTTPLCMKLYEEGHLDLSQPVERYLQFLKKYPAGKIPVRHLLCHVSGLEWWKPYYAELMKIPEIERKSFLKNKFRKEKVKKIKKSTYSDLDFILLGWIIEEILDMPLDEAAENFIFTPLHLKNSFFNPFRKKQCAPTGNDTDRKFIQGVVHDDNAWALSGVSGHAGLFSTLEDVQAIGQIYLDSYLRKSFAPFKASTLRFFAKRAIAKKSGDWGLGFMLPSQPVSTGGKNISQKAFGHTGFTGTSLWIDPTRKAVVSILSNRTYPTSKDRNFLKLRPEIHDLIWEMIDERK